MPLILMTILSFALKSSFSDGDYFDEGVKIAVVKLYNRDEDSKMFDETLRNGIFLKNMGKRPFFFLFCCFFMCKYDNPSYRWSERHTSTKIDLC